MLQYRLLEVTGSFLASTIWVTTYVILYLTLIGLDYNKINKIRGQMSDLMVPKQGYTEM